MNEFVEFPKMVMFAGMPVLVHDAFEEAMHSHLTRPFDEKTGRFPEMTRLHKKAREVACEGCSAPFRNNSGREMKYCGARCRYTSWTRNNRDRLNATVRKYRARRYAENGSWREVGKAAAMKAWVAELKSAPCTDCGNRFPGPAMDFDHREGTVKSNNVGTMVAHHHAREAIEAEIAKCDLVCSNCHRVRTQKRMTGRPRGRAKGAAQ